MARNLSLLLKCELPYICQKILRPKAPPPQLQVKLRLYGSTLTNAKHESGAPVYRKMDDEFKISKKNTVKTLVELLNIRTLDALQIIFNNSFFRQVSKNTLKNNYNLYKQSGILQETLWKYPEVLTIVDAEWKLHKIQKLPYNINDVVPLVLLPSTNFIKCVSSEFMVDKADSKIAILSSLLEISPQKACEYISQKPFLLTLSNEKIKENIQTLFEYGVTTESICNDLWVLRYSEELIRTRLSIAKEHNIDMMKTWMVRVQEGAFQTHIRRHSDNKSILGDNSLVEYLSERLECNVELVNYMILKQPAIKSKNMKKLNELIDFLYDEGFKPYHICRVPKILVHSVETTRKRLKQLEEKGIKIDSLSMLTKSQNQFMQYYEALLKSKNKSKSET